MMTAVFVFTPKNCTPQSLRCHSAPASKQWQNTMTAHSGRVCAETQSTNQTIVGGASVCVMTHRQTAHLTRLPKNKILKGNSIANREIIISQLANDTTFFFL